MSLCAQVSCQRVIFYTLFIQRHSGVLSAIKASVQESVIHRRRSWTATGTTGRQTPRPVRWSFPVLYIACSRFSDSWNGTKIRKRTRKYDDGIWRKGGFSPQPPCVFFVLSIHAFPTISEPGTAYLCQAGQIKARVSRFFFLL